MSIKTRFSSPKQATRRPRRALWDATTGRFKQRKTARRKPKVQIEDENGVIYDFRLLEETKDFLRVQIDTAHLAAIIDGQRRQSAQSKILPVTLDDTYERLAVSRTIQHAPKDAAVDLGRRIAERRAAMMRSLADA